MKKARGKEEAGRPVPLSTSQSASNSPRLNILSAWSSFLMWNRPREEGGREGDRGTRQDSSAAAERKREGQKATLSNRVARSVGRSFSGFLTKDVYVPAS